MGLDQYLTANVYGGAKWHKVKQNCLEVDNGFFTGQEKDIADFKDCKVLPTHNISHIIYDVGYWRKVNWVHKWFVDNVQSGNDDCEKYVVDEKQLDELYNLCGEILDFNFNIGLKDSKHTKEDLMELIKNKLPPQDGFFFGGTDLTDANELEYYLDSLVDTRCFIDTARQYIKKFGATIYYQSSW